MTEGKFSAGDWIDRLARALPALAEAQKPYLPGYRDIRAFLPAIPGVDDGGSPAVRVGELGGCTPGRSTATCAAKKRSTQRSTLRWTRFATSCFGTRRSPESWVRSSAGTIFTCRS